MNSLLAWSSYIWSSLHVSVHITYLFTALLADSPAQKCYRLLLLPRPLRADFLGFSSRAYLLSNSHLSPAEICADQFLSRLIFSRWGQRALAMWCSHQGYVVSCGHKDLSYYFHMWEEGSGGGSRNVEMSYGLELASCPCSFSSPNDLAGNNCKSQHGERNDFAIFQKGKEVMAVHNKTWD